MWQKRDSGPGDGPPRFLVHHDARNRHHSRLRESKLDPVRRASSKDFDELMKNPLALGGAGVGRGRGRIARDTVEDDVEVGGEAKLVVRLAGRKSGKGKRRTQECQRRWACLGRRVSASPRLPFRTSRKLMAEITAAFV